MREIGPSLVCRELVGADIKWRSWLQAGVDVASRLHDLSRLTCDGRGLGRRLAVVAEPLCFLDPDDLGVNRRIVTLLVPGRVAPITEDDHVRVGTMSPLAMDTNDVRLLLPGPPHTLRFLDGHRGRRERRGRLDGSPRPPRRVVGGKLLLRNLRARDGQIHAAGRRARRLTRTGELFRRLGKGLVPRDLTRGSLRGSDGRERRVHLGT